MNMNSQLSILNLIRHVSAHYRPEKQYSHIYVCAYTYNSHNSLRMQITRETAMVGLYFIPETMATP